MRILAAQRLAVVISIVLILFTPAPVQATSEHDVPGTPLPAGGLVESRVGGLIVDLVYAINVPASSVLVATVRGEPGAELGLYAFGDGIASILTAQPIASSAKPGGVQTISVRFIRESTVYLNVNGRNADRPYEFTLRATVLTDNTPPIVTSVTADPKSRSTSVCVTVRSSDPISGIAAILISEALSGWSADWEPFFGVGRHCVSVPAGDGAREFTVRIRNGVNLVSSPYRVYSTIDDAMPKLVLTRPTEDLLLEPRGILSWRFSEPIWSVAPLTQSVSVFDQDGRVIPGVVTRSASRTALFWTPTRNIPLGTVLMASLGAVRDSVGNILNFTDTSMLTRKRTTPISIQRLASSIKPKIRIFVPAWLVGVSVIIERKAPRGWYSDQTLTLTATSTDARIATESKVAIRVRVEGTDLFAPSRSNKVTLFK